MDKYLAKLRDFLEKYVQFVALALAGLALFWILFSYVLNPGVTSADLGAESVGPGDVDSRVYETSGRQLERAAQDTRVATAISPEDVDIILSPAPLAPVARMDGDSPAGVISVTPTPRFEREEIGPTGGGIAQLPELPPAEIVRVASFKSFADVPTDQVGLAEPEDVVGVVVRWTLPMGEIRERFRQVQLPPRISTTSLLDVRLVRERKLDDGSWGELTEITRLRNADWLESPSADADVDTKRAYRDFARENPSLVALPPFYPVIRGELPEKAAAEPVEELGSDDGDADAPPVPVRPRPQRPRPGNRGGPGGYGGGGYGGGGAGGPGGGSGGGFPGDSGGAFPGGGSGGAFPGDTGNPYAPPSGAGEDPGFIPGGPGQPNQPVFVGGDVPGEFNPANATGDIEGWAFDETAEPNETYRYNVAYSLRNPLFDTTNIADDPTIEQQLSLVVARDSAWVDSWSEEITIDPIVRWFMRNAGAEIAGRLQNARFSIFRWQEGTWHEEVFTATAGDPLGAERDGIDFATGHYLVDVREDPATGDSVAVVSGDNGRFTRHDDEEDESDDFDELKKLVQGDEVA
ncbi:MAG: hypothetical protein AAGI46_12405, partial [Planctomycetota bacterium]